MFGWFARRKEVEQLKEDTKKSFDSVKKDMNSVTGWIKHLNSEKDIQKQDLNNLKEDLSSIKEEIEGIKNILSMMGGLNNPSNNFKTTKRLFKQQTAVYPVQTAVQTAVQTPNLSQFSITERALVWVLLNSDLKLSYEDLSSILGKEKSTIRGQINTIKHKSESLIMEETEKNGKKRVYVPEEIKEKILKRTKVRSKTEQKRIKNQKVTKSQVSGY